MRIPVMIVVTAMSFSAALAYDPPEVLLRVETPITDQHCCLGDINNDGCDDFVTKQAPRGHTSQATFEFYYGGRPMSEEPGFTIPTHYPQERNGLLWMVGHFLPNQPDILLTTAWIHAVEGDTAHPYANEFRFVSLGDSTLGEILYSYRSAYNWRTGVGWIRPPAGNRLSRPADFNGDGYDDILIGSFGADGQNNQRVDAGEVWVILGEEVVLFSGEGKCFSDILKRLIHRYWINPVG